MTLFQSHAYQLQPRIRSVKGSSSLQVQLRPRILPNLSHQDGAGSTSHKVVAAAFSLASVRSFRRKARCFVSCYAKRHQIESKPRHLPVKWCPDVESSAETVSSHVQLQSCQWRVEVVGVGVMGMVGVVVQAKQSRLISRVGGPSL